MIGGNCVDKRHVEALRRARVALRSRGGDADQARLSRLNDKILTNEDKNDQNVSNKRYFKTWENRIELRKEMYGKQRQKEGVGLKEIKRSKGKRKGKKRGYGGIESSEALHSGRVEGLGVGVGVEG